MEKELTVILPVYNGAATVGQALEALLQNVPPQQIQVVNDGSTDQTRLVLKRYPVSVLHLPINQGIAHARNQGIQAARTRYLACVDVDCLVEEHWLQNMLKAYQAIRTNNNKLAALSGQVLPYNQTWLDLLAAQVEHWEYQGGVMEPRLKLSTSNCLLDGEVVRRLGNFDEGLTVDEDRELALRLVQNGYQVFYSPDFSIRHQHNRTRLRKIFQQQYYWGEKTGLINELKYKKIRHLWFLDLINQPWIYFAILPGLCAYLTLRILKRNLRRDWRLLAIVPLIFIAKLFYRLGVWQWLLKQPGAKA